MWQIINGIPDHPTSVTAWCDGQSDIVFNLFSFIVFLTPNSISTDNSEALQNPACEWKRNSDILYLYGENEW